MVEDLLEDGQLAPGGPSLYAARTAAALGARVTIVTALPPGYPQACLAELDLVGVPAPAAPRYANRYGPAGARTQLLLEEGAPLTGEEVRAALRERFRGAPPDALLLAPAYHELGGFGVGAWGCGQRGGEPGTLGARVLSASLQGALRRRLPDGRIAPCEDPFAAADPFVLPGALLFFSEEDTAAPEALATHIAARGAVAVLTRGERGASLYKAGDVRHYPALPAHATDPTGAGDCFAAAFTLRYAETDDLDAAAAFALAAGAIAVEQPGLACIPSRAAIEARLPVGAA